jgi:glycosidase
MKNYKKNILFFIIIIISSCSTEKKNNADFIFSPPDWSYNATIYEANIRQFSIEGNFSSFEKHLPKIKEMGIKIIWLMPIHPIGELNRKGTLGSYYSVKDYKGINPNFGNEEDLKRLIEKIHQLDMYVIIDWVANHTSWDHPWTKTNPEFYIKDSLGNFMPPVEDWSDVIDLDYNNYEMREEMKNSLKYWIEEFNIDGYRCDVAYMVPNDFWKNTIAELKNIKPIFMLAEADNQELHENGFDMTYSWKLKDLMNNFAKGEASIDEFKSHFLISETQFPQNAFRMNFTTNHDENSWDGTVFERLGSFAEPFTVLISTAKGMPLVYSGQEAGMNKRLEFFEKDTITWNEHKNRDIFTKIFNVKKRNKALWNGDKGGDINFIDVSKDQDILAFYRKKENDKVIVVLNLSNKNVDISFNQEILFGGYEDLFNEQRITIDSKSKFEINPFGYLVLTN